MKTVGHLSVRLHRIQVPRTCNWFYPQRWTRSSERLRIQKLVELGRRSRILANDAEDGDIELEIDERSPDFDDLVLDDKFYEDMDEDREMLEKHPPWAPETADPQGYNQTFEKYLESRKDIPEYIKTDLRDAQYFGPPIVLLAGFRLEELPIIRLTVDKLLGEHVKVVPVFGAEVLQMPVEEALELPEPDWSEPRPSNWTRSGTWGSQRTIVFGGLPMESQAILIEVIEESGLPPVCCSIASSETRHMKLGDLLADAIKLQRDRKNPEKNVWEIDDRMVDDVSDLQEFYTSKLTERVKAVQEGLESGAACLEEDEKSGILKVKMDGLKEEIFDPEEIAEFNPKKNAPVEPHVPKSPPTPVSNGTADAKQKERTKPERKVVELDEEGDHLLKSESQEHVDTGDSASSSLSDFFAVDDLVCDELGMEKPKRPEKPSVSIPPPYKPPKDDTPSTGNVYPISTEPETVREGVKRSTVFSGLVKDSTAFLQENFDYDIKKGGTTPTPEEDMETVTFDINSLAEQEAFDYRDPEEREAASQAAAKSPPSVEDVIQSAVRRGVDPTELQRLIESLPSAKSSERSNLRKRLRQRRYR